MNNLTPKQEVNLLVTRFGSSGGVIVTLKNADARKLLDVLELLRNVSVDVSLEKQSIAHKIQALLSKERSVDMTASELITDMDDDELGWAIAQEDPRIGCIKGFALDPKLFNYLRRERPRALAIADEVIRLSR
ncbi:hypothetical protein [Allocoleopsis sp.]|uniref:hypothetical protein n=1 Tax=Allocoleopsis sp. TaxID=3088169 RepID=UPI002FD6AD1A